MRRKLLLLNLALLVLIAAAGYRLRLGWLEARSREALALSQKMKLATLAPASAPVPAQPIAPAAYIDVAQKMLFTKDRNPTVVLDVAPPKPMPPLPVAYGVLDLGNGPTAFLSEKGKPQKGVRPGESIGAFKLLAASKDEITLEWDGKPLRKKLDELLDRDATPVQAPAPAPAAEPQRVQPVKSGNPTFGVDIGGGIRACVPSDTTPAGTILEGYKKVTGFTPMGKHCHWELIPK